MSIFGNSKPKIIYENASGVLTTLVFPTDTIVDNPKIIKNRILQQSILTGKRHYREIGKHAEYNITILNITSSLFNELKYIEGKEVQYYPHSDQAHCIICFVDDVIPFYYKKRFFKV